LTQPQIKKKFSHW